MSFYCHYMIFDTWIGIKYCFIMATSSAIFTQHTRMRIEITKAQYQIQKYNSVLSDHKSDVQTKHVQVSTTLRHNVLTFRNKKEKCICIKSLNWTAKQLNAKHRQLEAQYNDQLSNAAVLMSMISSKMLSVSWIALVSFATVSGLQIMLPNQDNVIHMK